MSKRLDNIFDQAVPLPIPEVARQTAAQFAAEQPSTAKANQVHSNTLAVWVMNDYFKMIGFPTDLEHSDSWNPTVRLMADVADLVLPGVGRIECRPTATLASVCAVPPETWTLRVGYGVVELSEDLQTARLLGFTTTVVDEMLAIEDLSSPEALIDHLQLLRQSQSVAIKASVEKATVEKASNTSLSQWFDRIFEPNWLEAGWQTMDTLLNTVNLTPAFNLRSHVISQLDRESGTDIRKGKMINLALRLGFEQVLLLIHLQSQSLDEIHISVQVYPVSQPCLPQNLELLILEASGEVFMQAQARKADNYIQLQFNGKPGEPFKTQIKLEDIYHIEQFVV